MEWIHVRRLKTLSLRPIQWVYGLILITVLSFLGFAWHSIQAFDDKVYSLREGYLNEITHALAGPLAVLEDIGMNDQASLGRVFAPFQTFEPLNFMTLKPIVSGYSTFLSPTGRGKSFLTPRGRNWV